MAEEAKMYNEHVSFDTPEIRSEIEKWLSDKGFPVNEIPKTLSFFREIEMIDDQIDTSVEIMGYRNGEPDSATIRQIRLRNGLVSWIYWVYKKNRQQTPDNLIRQKNWLEGRRFKAEEEGSENIIKVEFSNRRGSNERKKQIAISGGEIIPLFPRDQEKGAGR